MPASILLVRHGQSTWNAEGRWQGTEDPPLSTLGVRQARAAAATVGAFDLIASSTLERARTTAEIVAGELGVGPVVAEPGLVERHAGVFQGMTKVEIEAAYPGWLAEQRRPDDWEHDDAVLDRATTAIGRLAAEVGDGTAFVVSHGGVLTTLVGAFDGEPGRFPNLGGMWVHVGPGEFRLGERVELVPADLHSETPGGQV